MGDPPDGDSPDADADAGQPRAAPSVEAVPSAAAPTGSQLEPDVAEDVYPEFDDGDPDEIDSDVIPRIEPPASGGGEIYAGVLPAFEEPDHSPVVPTPGAGSPAAEAPHYVPEVEEEDERDDFGITGPEYDKEMPLAYHIEEMIKRLAVVIVVAGSVTLVTFPFADQIIDFMWFAILPGTDVAQPRVYGPLEFLLTQIKVASLAGLVVALPVLVYETYAFMRPGLYRHERRYYLAAIPTSLVLAIIGVAFAFVIILPALFTFFLGYSEDAGEIAFALAQTFDLMLILMAYLAVVFQIPLFIMLAIMMGLTTRQWLADKRLYFWGAFLGISFISSPDPTGMAPILVALTMVGLFEGTIGLLKWVGK